ITNIFTGQNHHSSGYEFRILSSGYHSGKIIYCSIGVTTSYRLYKGRDDIIMHFAILIILADILKYYFFDRFIRDLNVYCGCSIENQLQQIEYFSAMSATILQ